MPAIGIGVNTAKGGSQSLSSYWTQQRIADTFLFYGETSKITGGKLYNQVKGSSDYLTVGGSAGSETYQAPNNATYQTADTDYIWFKTDASQRTTTTAELIDYDLQRTPVKYDDNSPNTIRAIGILKTGVTLTGASLDSLFSFLWLPIEWNNDTNAYGHIKDNRVGQNLWTPEPITILQDLFTDTNGVHLHDHTMNVGAGWTAPVNFIISGNKVAFSGASPLGNAVVESSKANVDITVDVDMPNENQYYGGLVFRYADDSNYWRLYIQRDSGGTPYLALNKNATKIASENITQETATNKLRLVCSGDNIYGYWKNITTPLITQSDATYNDHTKHGLTGCLVAGYVMPVMDNFITIG